MCVKFCKMVMVADVLARVDNTDVLPTGIFHAALRMASFFNSLK